MVSNHMHSLVFNSRRPKKPDGGTSSDQAWPSIANQSHGGIGQQAATRDSKIQTDVIRPRLVTSGAPVVKLIIATSAQG